MHTIYSMKNDSKMNIKETLLDKDVKQESLAEALIKAFDDAGRAMEEQTKMIDKVFTNIGKSELMRALVSKTNYFFKYQTSNWLTRWYWKRKYEKARKGCDFWERYVSQLKNG